MKGRDVRMGAAAGSTAFRVSAPGNIILLGEYAVLEEGGLGIAAAVDRRVVIDVTSAAELSVRLEFGGRTTQWHPGGPSERGDLVDRIITFLSSAWEAARRNAPAGSLVINSEPFFDSSGRKLGFGASAAVTVALVGAFSRLVDLSDAGSAHAAEDARGPSLQTVVDAHRRAQAGRGSGYDVAASMFGGFGIFHGGGAPSWEPIEADWVVGSLPMSCILRAKPVSTVSAIARYHEWKASNPESARRFLHESNDAVRAFSSAGTASAAKAAFVEARNIGLELGRRIGVPAEIDFARRRGECKAVGAGNELGVCIDFEGEHDGVVAGDAAEGLPVMVPLTVARKGLVIDP